MTVLGSVSSCLFGGWIGDYAATHWKLGTVSRLVVAGASLVIAAPCYYGVYVLPYLGCFGMIAFGGFFGEVYYGLVLAVLALVTAPLVYLSQAGGLSGLVSNELSSRLGGAPVVVGNVGSD